TLDSVQRRIKNIILHRVTGSLEPIPGDFGHKMAENTHVTADDDSIREQEPHHCLHAQSRDGKREDEHPEHGEDAQYVSPPREDVSTLWSQHGDQPVHTHECDEHDGGIHVGVAQIEKQLAHGASKHPRLLGQVHNEEHGEAHDGTISTRQVQDDQRGD
ncbi:hypothetical protein PGIGA_G00206960, partial [Pangasianodon gigas]|nr:hypothetical protein [Pangasianodon gigas]